jgi:hypothetical protein
MATQGPWTLFDRVLKKLGDGTIPDLDGATVKAVLLGSAQALTRSFLGSSGDCRYADLTAEFSTANGYTAGGVTLAGITLTRVTVTVTDDAVRFTGNPISWTITGAGLTGVKYLALYVDNTNDDLLAFSDMDTDSPGTNTVTLAAGAATWTAHANGFFRWKQ